MAETKYEIIHRDHDVHTEQEEDDLEEYSIENSNRDFIRGTTLKDDQIINNNNNIYPKEYINRNIDIMQTPSAILALILVYFGLSIGLTFYQRHLLYEFHFPLSVVLYHLILKLVMAAVIRIMYTCLTGRSRVHIDWRKSLEKLAPTGVAAGMDIGFSNWGLELVTVSLYTMTKSTTIIFILVFAILCGLEKKSGSLMFIVIMISGGLFMFTFKSTEFNAWGFTFLLFASFTSGIRWTFAQFIMQKTKLGLHNPIDMIYFMQPWMIVALLPLTIAFEGNKIMNSLNPLPDTLDAEIMLIGTKITMGAFIAFAMEISEFLVISYTSSLTLSILGIFKEICQLILAFKVSGDQFTITKLLGLTLCLGGICLHVIHKFSVMRTHTKVPIIIDNTLMTSPTSYEHHLQINHSNSRSDGPGAGTNSKQKIKMDYFSGQHRPLLDSTDDAFHSDSDDSQFNNQNASEVIFDILKRRDAQR